MQNLLIEQKGPNGLMKTWKLRAEQKLLTFGHSKHADLRTSIESIKGIQGVFEFKNNKWYYINLDLHTKHSEIPENQVEFCIERDCELRMGTQTLSIKILEGKSPLFSKLEGEVSDAGPGTHAYQLFTVYSGSTLLETTLIPFEKKFVSKHDIAKTSFAPVMTKEWQRTSLGHMEISQRTVHLSSADAFKHLNSSELIDADAKKSLQFISIAAFLLLMIFVFSPKKDLLEESLTPPPLQAREVKMEIPKKKKPAVAEKKAQETAPAPVQQVAQQEPQAAPQPQAAPKGGDGGSRAASMIKNLASGRITSLVGKVAASAKSANVVVTSGVVAGSQSTGRALAAIGNISKSGKDWSS